MYADPAHIRKHVVKVRLNDEQLKVLADLAEAERSQIASKAFEIIFEALADRISQRRQIKQSA